jgi:hypothetical protein
LFFFSETEMFLLKPELRIFTEVATCAIAFGLSHWVATQTPAHLTTGIVLEMHSKDRQATSGLVADGKHVRGNCSLQQQPP